MRAVYAGLLIGFTVAAYKLAGADHARFIIPLGVLTVAGWVGAGEKQ
jgi:hypothetical protein